MLLGAPLDEIISLDMAVMSEALDNFLTINISNGNSLLMFQARFTNKEREEVNEDGWRHKPRLNSKHSRWNSGNTKNDNSWKIPNQGLGLFVYHRIVMSYCILAWGHTCNTKHLNTFQKKAVRKIISSGFSAHSEPLLKNLKLLKSI